MIHAPDGQEFPTYANGGLWRQAWHPPTSMPAGKPHGANALCVTAEGEIVLISHDGRRWSWPGGRPEGSETWEQTMRREVLEEACAIVNEARLLGFARGVCTSGPEEGLVLVRSIWRAEVQLSAWTPRHEVPHRRTVPVGETLAHFWMEEGLEPLYHRAFLEAGLTSTFPIL